MQIMQALPTKMEVSQLFEVIADFTLSWILNSIVAFVAFWMNNQIIVFDIHVTSMKKEGFPVIKCLKYRTATS